MEFPLQIVEVISFYFVRNAILWNLWVPSWGTVNIASDICFEIKSWTQPAFWNAFQKSCGTHMWAIVVRIPRMLQIFTQSWFYLSPSNQMILNWFSALPGTSWRSFDSPGLTKVANSWNMDLIWCSGQLTQCSIQLIWTLILLLHAWQIMLQYNTSTIKIANAKQLPDF